MFFSSVCRVLCLGLFNGAEGALNAALVAAFVGFYDVGCSR